MEHQPPCDHRWRYIVTVATRAVRARRCDHCGQRSLVPKARPAAKQPEVALRSA